MSSRPNTRIENTFRSGMVTAFAFRAAELLDGRRHFGGGSAPHVAEFVAHALLYGEAFRYSTREREEAKKGRRRAVSTIPRVGVPMRRTSRVYSHAQAYLSRRKGECSWSFGSREYDVAMSCSVARSHAVEPIKHRSRGQETLPPARCFALLANGLRWKVNR